MHDLSADLARLGAHLPCLERAAADPSAPAPVRARVAAIAQAVRSAVGIAGGTDLNDSERHETEAGRGHA